MHKCLLLILLYFVKTEEKNEDQLVDAVFRAQKSPLLRSKGVKNRRFGRVAQLLSKATI